MGPQSGPLEVNEWFTYTGGPVRLCEMSNKVGSYIVGLVIYLSMSLEMFRSQVPAAYSSLERPRVGLASF